MRTWPRWLRRVLAKHEIASSNLAVRTRDQAPGGVDPPALNQPEKGNAPGKWRLTRATEQVYRASCLESAV